MAEKVFSSIIDAILDEREPDWKALNLKDEKKSGEDVLDRTHQYADKDFLDEIAESASRHTSVPPSKSATLTNRLAEKESAAPQVASVKADWRKEARRDSEDFKNSYGDNDSLLDEVTMSLEKAESEGKVEKKEWSDGQIQSYIRGLLNQGDSPSKVAAKLEKLAEIELFNHQMSTDYLQRNAGMLGLAYLEPNTFMDKQNPNYRHNAGVKESKTFDTSTVEGLKAAERYKAKLENKYDKVVTTPVGMDRVRIEGHYKERTAGSNDCVRAHEAMKQAGIKPQAHSVKQIKACTECSFFKKDASGKRCNLYHLPVVASTQELSQIVNHLTPGVPNNKKHAALVQIANRMDEHVQPFDAGKTAQTNIVKTADARVDNQAKRQLASTPKFYAEHVAKLHSKGVSLKDAYNWASKKFGSVEVSIAFRGFVQSLRKNAKGRVVVANSDLKFLNSIGIRSESFEGNVKCASCPSHFHHEAASKCPKCGGSGRNEEATRKMKEREPSLSGHVRCSYCNGNGWEPADGFNFGDKGSAMRVDGKFAQRTASVVAGQQEEKPSITLTAANVRSLHQKGHSLEKIYIRAAAKVGSLQAKKAVGEFVISLKKTPARIAVSASDKSFLVGKLGMKPEALRTLEAVRRPTDRVVASVPDDVRVLAYPGMEKQASGKVTTDGHSILNEYDLRVSHDQPLDMNEPERLDVESGSTFKVELE